MLSNDKQSNTFQEELGGIVDRLLTLEKEIEEILGRKNPQPVNSI